MDRIIDIDNTTSVRTDEQDMPTVTYIRPDPPWPGWSCCCSFLVRAIPILCRLHGRSFSGGRSAQ